MTVLPQDLVERARARREGSPLAPWPSVLLGTDLQRLRDRIEAALAVAPDFVVEQIHASLGDTSDLGLRGLSELWTAGLALAAGWQPVAREQGAWIVERGPDRAALLPVPLPTRPVDPELQQSLEEGLAVVFDGRPWSLVVRRPLPDDLEVPRVLEPVRMWLAALERGRWDGDYAIYEDHGVSLELRVLGSSRGAVRGPDIRVPGLATGDLLLRVEARLIAVLESCDLPDELPLIPVLTRGGPWDLATRSRLELVYGKLHQKVVTGDRTSLTFRSDGGGLLARASFDRLAALWWLGADPADPLVPRGVADENPWGLHPAEGPGFPGLRHTVAFIGDPEAPAIDATLNLGRPERGLQVPR